MLPRAESDLSKDIKEKILICRRKEVYKKDVNEVGKNEHGKRCNQRQLKFIIEHTRKIS